MKRFKNPSIDAMIMLDENSAIALSLKTFNGMRRPGFKIIKNSIQNRRGTTKDVDATYYPQMPEWVITFSIDKSPKQHFTRVREDQVIDEIKLHKLKMVKPHFMERLWGLTYEILDAYGNVIIRVNVEYEWLKSVCPPLPVMEAKYLIIESRPWNNDQKIWDLIYEPPTKKKAESLLKMRKEYVKRYYPDDGRKTRILAQKDANAFINAGNKIVESG